MNILVKILASLLAGGLLCAAAFTANAQSYPTKPIRVIAGYAAGGSPQDLKHILGNEISKWKTLAQAAKLEKQ